MLTDKNIFITGANGGIGLETVKILTQHKVRRIALACRTIEKAERTKQQLLKQDETGTQLEPYGGFGNYSGSLII